jgi:hypothetical protein
MTARVERVPVEDIELALGNGGLPEDSACGSPRGGGPEHVFYNMDLVNEAHHMKLARCLGGW